MGWLRLLHHQDDHLTFPPGSTQSRWEGRGNMLAVVAVRCQGQGA